MPVILATAVIAFLTLTPLDGQTPAAPYRAPRTKDGHPDLNGVWQALNTANWDLQSHGVRPALALRQGRVPGTVQPAAPVMAMGAIGGVPAGFGVVEGDEIP